ncbi:MAG: hypothetical protein ACD_29C00408G0001 [uncultured bacterium]|nr:MAG: hypothetical protein ACD_29C00408G0001 [uncultured bacterium]
MLDSNVTADERESLLNQRINEVAVIVPPAVPPAAATASPSNLAKIVSFYCLMAAH